MVHPTLHMVRCDLGAWGFISVLGGGGVEERGGGGASPCSGKFQKLFDAACQGVCPGCDVCLQLIMGRSRYLVSAARSHVGAYEALHPGQMARPTSTAEIADNAVAVNRAGDDDHLFGDQSSGPPSHSSCRIIGVYANDSVGQRSTLECCRSNDAMVTAKPL